MICLATKNEQGTIWPLLDKLRDYPVIIVDDSDDATPAIARRFSNVEVIKGDGKGIAAAYVKAFSVALSRGDADIIQMDAGMSHDPEFVKYLLNHKEDLVLGVRQFHYAGYRTLISKTAAFMMREPDATCGFRRWKAPLLRRIGLHNVKSQGFAFQIELLKYAKRLGASIGYEPIPYHLSNSTFKPSMLVEAMKVYLS